ncbi:hypothetical protein CBOM_06947 [Ceraceosorus bombacis]|uniref:DUF218 domain-containing protein n=1 Tax=Ceraceosorus bombacis TaxID=401625 RepID=A0A0P1BK61_9BASI|nr:hypothetical protein CBOM_06947 [Ceraceosorus bombacis]
MQSSARSADGEEAARKRSVAQWELRQLLWERGVSEGVPLAFEALQARSEVQEVSSLSQSCSSSKSSSGSEYIVILGVPVNPDGSIGASLRSRIDRSIALSRAHPCSTLIPTGSAVANAHGEALSIAQELFRAGVPKEKVVCERNARTTLDNAAFVWILLSEMEGFAEEHRSARIDRHSTSSPTWKNSKVQEKKLLESLTVVAEPYHAMRSLRIFCLLNRAKPIFQSVRIKPSERVPLLDSGPRTELERCIEEKRRVWAGW